MKHHSQQRERELLRKLERVEQLEERIEKLEERILHRLLPTPVTHFSIKESTMVSIAPGNAPVFTATPQPTGVALDPKQPIPVWTSSDPVNAPESVDATGLICTVNIPATASVGSTFTLTVTYKNADGSTATGTFEATIVAGSTPPPPPPEQNVTSFTIAQTA